MLQFFYAFKINALVVFEVEYYYLGGNKKPYFSTSAAEFNRRKTDWNICGQAQKSLLKGSALKFYEKWDHKHLNDLTESEYTALLNDLKELERCYKFLHKIQETRSEQSFSFEDLKQLSKQK